MALFTTIRQARPVYGDTGLSVKPLLGRLTDYLRDRDLLFRLEINRKSMLLEHKNVPSGALKTLSLELTLSQLKEQLFGNCQNPLSETFNQAVCASEKIAAELTCPERAELKLMPDLLRLFAGTPVRDMRIEKLLMGTPQKVALRFSFLKDEPLAVSCPQVRGLSDILAADLLSERGPVMIKEYEGGLLYWRSDSEAPGQPQFHFVRLQIIPVQRTAVEVSVNFKDPAVPRIRTRIFDIDQSGVLRLRSGSLSQSLDRPGNSPFPFIDHIKTSLQAALRLAPASSLDRQISFSLARDQALIAELGEEMIASLKDLKQEPNYASYLKYLPAPAPRAEKPVEQAQDLDSIGKNGSYFPTRYHLPGYRGEADLQSVYGAGRRNILHALTFHAVPRNLDDLVENCLPPEEELSVLNPLRRAYVSFTVYSLKQMVAAGTIGPETAWSLFHGEWGRIGQVESGNFRGMRDAFYRDSHSRVQAGQPLPDLRQFEFLARAGAAGLAKYERYAAWAQRLVFNTKDWPGMPEAVKEEYRRALWLEMRLIEDRVGCGIVKQAIEYFDYSRDDAQYHPAFNGITAGVDFPRSWFDHQHVNDIDGNIKIKSEIGHWLFDGFCLSNNWAAELMDRMNMTDYTAAVGREGNDSPEVRAFYQGGHYLSAGHRRYPTYPEEYPGKPADQESHAVAERIERQIRINLSKAVRAGKMEQADIYRWYRKIGVYAILLDLEGKEQGEIEQRLDRLDLPEIEAYCAIRPILERSLLETARPPETRYAIGRALKEFGSDSSLPVWEKILADPKETFGLKRTAVEALGKISSARSRCLLEKLLADPKEDKWLRWTAQRVLRQMPLPSAEAA
jgi:hypothetical protein